MRVVSLFFVVLLSLVSVVLAEQKTSLNSSGLDPEEGSYFIVSTVFEIGALPKSQGRLSILSKIATFGRSQVGYGLSLRAFQTSIRPQVYWSAGEGDGGFLTFGSYDFRPRHRYALTLVARAGEFISMYVQERSRKSSEAFPRGENISKVTFLGGHDLKGTAAPKNNVEFNYKVSEEAEKLEHVGVLAAFVASVPKLKDSIDKLTIKLDGAPESLATSLSADEVRLWEVSSLTESIK